MVISVNIKHNYPYVILLVIAAIVIHWIWFDPTSILTSSDWGYYQTNILNGLTKTWSTWKSFDNFGSVNIQLPFFVFMSVWNLLSLVFHFPYDLITKITFFIPIAITVFLAPYFLVNKIVSNKTIAFFCALFYGTTTYGIVNQPPIQMVYALAPLLLMMFIKALERESIKSWISFSLLFSVSIVYEVRITYIVAIALTLYLLINYNKTTAKNLHYLTTSAIITLILNVYWLLPVIFGKTSEQIALTANRGLFGNQLFDLAHSFTISTWYWTGGDPNNTFIKQDILFHLWLIPFLIVGGLIITKLKNKLVLYFLLIAVLGILLSKQVSSPFPAIYTWLYGHFPGFNLFREASKFYILISLGYLGCLALVLAALKRHFSNKVIYLAALGVVCVSCLINAKPIITGKLGGLTVSRNSPKAYEKANSFMEKNDQSALFQRTLWIPTSSRWGYYSTTMPKSNAINNIENNWKSYSDVPTHSNSLSTIETVQKLMTQPSANNLHNNSSIRWIVIPFRDLNNNDDFYTFYGNDRQFYVDLLDDVPWLKKVDIGTKELAIYENENYKPYFSSFTNLTNIGGLGNLDEVYNFATNELGNSDLQFNVINKKNKADEHSIHDLFGDLKRNELKNNGIERNFETRKGQDQSIYANNNRPLINYRIKNNTLTFEEQKLYGPFIQQTNNNLVQGANTGINSVLLDDSEYFINIGSDMLAVDRRRPNRSLGVVKSAPILMKADTQNLVPNPSLEEGLWQQKVGDCNNFDNDAQIKQQLIRNDSTHGDRSLRLEADKHTACTGPNEIPVIPGGQYLFNFDYKVFGGRQAGYEIQYIDSKTKPRKEYLYLNDNNWRQLSTLIKVPQDASAIRILIKGFPDDRNKVHAVTHYDNLRLSNVSTILNINIDVESQYTLNQSMHTNAGKEEDEEQQYFLDHLTWQHKI